MKNVFFTIIKADCQEISSSLNDNGLLEFTVPKNYTNEELAKYFNNLVKEEYSKIIDKQKKAKEVFRKKVQKMIEKYREEFALDILVNLRIQNKTKKLVDCRVEVHGIEFDSNLLIGSELQYFPDELVEKVIRCNIYDIARKYENLCSQIKYMTAGGFEFPDGEIASSKYKVSEKEMYRISVPYSEILKITEDYETARNQLLEDMRKRPIKYI